MDKHINYHACKLRMEFDEKRLLEDFRKADSSAWIPHFVKSNYEGDWSAVPLYSVNGEQGHIIPDVTVTSEDFKETPILNECPYFKAVIDAFKCEKTAVRLMRLSKGSEIKEHVDMGLSMEESSVRVHVPVVTNPDVEFIVDKKRVVMGAGECWYIDALLPHSVANKGDNDRIHMVLDLEINDWVKELFESSGFVKRVKDPLEKMGIRLEDVDHVLDALKQMDTEAAQASIERIEAAKTTTMKLKLS